MSFTLVLVRTNREIGVKELASVNLEAPNSKAYGQEAQGEKLVIAQR